MFTAEQYAQAQAAAVAAAAAQYYAAAASAVPQSAASPTTGVSVVSSTAPAAFPFAQANPVATLAQHPAMVAAAAAAGYAPIQMAAGVTLPAAPQPPIISDREPRKRSVDELSNVS